MRQLSNSRTNNGGAEMGLKPINEHFNAQIQYASLNFHYENLRKRLYIKIKILLFSILILFFIPGLIFGEGCEDSIPQAPGRCEQVLYLGENKGCACFVCNPDKRDKTKVCTRDREVKKELFKKPRKNPTPPR